MREEIRILDVNFNRAREAIRVIEDYTRFVLDNEPLTTSLRNIRHNLARLLKRTLSDRRLISARNVKDDIGRESISKASTTQEIVIANFKRLQESLRSLAEYLKPVNKHSASEIEKMRFAVYELEQQLTIHLFPEKAFQNMQLYVLVSSDTVRQPVIEVVRQAIRGGADAIQLREKSMPDKVLLTMAHQIRKVTLARQVLFIVNDRLDIALLSRADGVHLGKEDISIRQARGILGPDKIIGATSHNIKEAVEAQRNGADYISVGPMFSSPTKQSLLPRGFSYLKEVARKISIPYVAIGGINQSNLPVLIKQHRKLFRYPLKAAVSSGIISRPDPARATSGIKKVLTKSLTKHKR